ncbi:GNAT family N-acetyltransferase [Priestia taiwanensis]|uniref:Acetyltransferase n=1 Tax=Priestia taiwanensis TaxID=1347902 RepID=A0A917EP04_9BACI|nr:GNAT family N-acetyltransferase [Priestia taiwanensis]MBM7362966.1 putative acetyltransferase [Priestia taiwanensis]GGE66531.1 acetyltransferase [Priestia taiwanensis]
MQIMKFHVSDSEEVLSLFYDTVHIVNANDYSKEQLDVWAPISEKDNKMDIWGTSLTQNITYVAKKDGRIVGFGDLTSSGYLDRLYVHKDYQRQGIASALIHKLEREAKRLHLPEVHTHASITAKLFFLSKGYTIVCEQTVHRQGIALINYKMRKQFV